MLAMGRARGVAVLILSQLLMNSTLEMVLGYLLEIDYYWKALE